MISSDRAQSSEPGQKDPLTGALSRASLGEQLPREAKRAYQQQENLSLLLLDLDYFKNVNDAFGHTRGDQVLQECVTRLQQLIPRSGLLFRYGGDEFVILLPQAPKSEAAALAQHLLETIRSTSFPGDPPVFLSVSIGVATLPTDAQSPEALFERADRRHNEAKRRGRGQVVSETDAESTELPFEASSRLIEREGPAQALHWFLQALPKQRRGVLRVGGAPGSGQSFFLAEVGRAARLRGFKVLSIRGKAALRSRPYGALYASQREWVDLPPTSVGAPAFAQSLQKLIEERGRAGVLWTVDELHELDQATLEFIQSLFVSAEIECLALAYTDEEEVARRALLLQAPLEEQVELQPFSQDGLRIWLRSLLQWEPPQAFLHWLYQQTDGLPAQLRQGISHLVNQEILQKSDQGWRLAPNFEATQLRAWLQSQREAPRHNLPLTLTNFIGRDQEIQHIKVLLHTRQLVTILGPGGIGKTRLAVQTAAEVLDDFPDGVCFLSLSAIYSPDLLVSSVVNELKLPNQGQEEARTQLLHYLRDKRMLLVMDNFEHLVEGADLLAEILTNARNVTILVTSRERLHLEQEWTFEIQGLSFPRNGSSLQAQSHSAVQLFVQTAQRVNPTFALPEDEIPYVIRTCQLVEGMPLGIELAAAWVQALSCQEIAQEIEDNLDFLTTSLRDIPPRHRSLRAVFEHSWAMLSEEEKSVFRKLSIFQGGFALDAAKQVAGASRTILASLMDKSLLHQQERTPGKRRYQMHEVLKQYADEKLQERPAERSGLHAQHCSYYATFLEQRADAVRGNRQREVLEEIHAEIDNIRMGWSWAIQNDRHTEIGGCLEGLYRFYDIRGWLQEGADQFTRAVAKLRQAKHHEDILGRAIARQGRFCLRLGLYEQAKHLLQESVDTLHPFDLPEETAFGLSTLGLAEFSLGDYSRARQLFQESLELYTRVGNRGGIAISLNNLGLVARRLAEYEEARRFFRESLAIYKEIGDLQGMAFPLGNLGVVAEAVGDYAEAQQIFEEALAICQEINDRWGVANYLSSLGFVAFALDAYQESWRLFCETLKAAMEIQAIPLTLHTLVAMARTLMKVEDRERALEILTFALRHPASYDYTRAFAADLLDEMRSDVSPHRITEIEVQVQGQRLEEVVAELLNS